MNVDAAVADRIVEFIFDATGRYPIICDLEGIIIAAKDRSRVGKVHPGARIMLKENRSEAVVTLEEEAASGGTMKAGCNLPIRINGEVIGSIGIGGDPERTEPMTRLAAGLMVKELREREMRDLLMCHVAQMDTSITEIVHTVARADTTQLEVSAEVGEVEALISASFEDIKKTDDVIDTIQAIAGNTQMLGLNASIEAAHAREHGRGFSIVAQSVQKLSAQCSEAAESVRATQTHLQNSMSRVVGFSKNLMASTREQTKATTTISRMVADLKSVSAALINLAKN